MSYRYQPQGGRPGHRPTSSMSAISTLSLYPSSSAPTSPSDLTRSPSFAAFGIGLERFGGAAAGDRNSVRAGTSQYDENIQNKAFCRWVNEKLGPHGYEPLTDLGSDFADGTKLIQLVEVLTEESLGRYNRAPVMRVQRAENVSRALDRIKQMGVILANIGPEDIMDGNRKLTLGLVWSLVKRFSIADINEEGSHAKEGLLLWCQRKTQGYDEVNVQNFTRSFQDGLAFCALIHCHRPDLLDFDSLSKDPASAEKNTALAFKIAEEDLGIAPLLDVEDVCGTRKPDERSVMTYIAQFFHAFSTKATQETAAKVLHNFAQHMRFVLTGIHEYETRADQLLTTLSELFHTWDSNPPSRPYASLKAARAAMREHKKVQKRALVSEKSEVAALLVHLNIKLGTYGLRSYGPPEGLAPADIEEHWGAFLDAEEARTRAINAEIRSLREEARVRFARLANSFHQELSEVSAALATLDGEASLDSQLESLRSLQGCLPTLAEDLESIASVERFCLECEVEENDHSSLTHEELAFELEQLTSALAAMKAFISNQVVARSVKKVTPEQLEEFESAFRAFDIDGSNSLDSDELAAALRSLGISEVPTQEFDPEGVSFEAFIRFLVDRNEDRHSVEKVRSCFRDAGQDKGYVTELDLRRLQLPESSLEWLKTNMPGLDDLEGEEGARCWDYDGLLDGFAEPLDLR